MFVYNIKFGKCINHIPLRAQLCSLQSWVSAFKDDLLNGLFLKFSKCLHSGENG